MTGWDGAAVIAKAVTYAATLSAAGGIFFAACMRSLITEEIVRRVHRLVIVTLWIAGLASIGRILLLAGSLSGELGGMFDGGFAAMILRGGEERATGARLLGLGLAGAALRLQGSRTARFRARGAGSRSRSLLYGAGALGGALIAATSFAWVGHVHALLPDPLPTLALAGHLLCAAFWLGAFAPLLLVIRHGSLTQIAAVAGRFGRLALGVVAALLGFGAFVLWHMLTSVAQLWQTGYGRMLSLKLLLVAALLGVAAFNKLHLTRQLRAGQAQAAISLQRSLYLEIVLGASILAMSAALTTLAGAPRLSSPTDVVDEQASL